MNTIIKISGMVLAGVLFIFASCRKYQVVSPVKDINEVVIGGLQSSYTALLGTHYQVQPSLTFTKDNSTDTARYKYIWYTLNPGLNNLDANYKVVLDSTKDLTSKVNLGPGSYFLYYIVKDTVSGVSWQKTVSLKVATPYYEGWLVLSDAGAVPRLDLVSYDAAGVGTPIYDVLGKLGSGLVLSGDAKNVVCTPGYPNYGIYITTSSNGTNSVDPENFSWVSTNNIRYSILDNTIPSNFYADPFVSFDMYSFSGTLTALYQNGNVYVTQNGTYVLPVNRFKGEAGNFYASPFFAGMGAVYLYDTLKRRFGYNNIFLNNYCVALPAYGTPGATMFDFNNTGMDLIWMGFSMYNGSNVYCILKEPATGNYHLALINYNGQSQTYYQDMTATDLASAAHFAISVDYGYVFYAVGGKLYEYDLGLKSSKLMADYGAGQITDISSGIPLADQNAIVPLKRKLIVSSYDPGGTAGSNGKLEIFTIPPVNGSLVLNESYTGFGKIKSVSYRQRP